MTNDLDTLTTALYVRIDDLLKPLRIWLLGKRPSVQIIRANRAPPTLSRPARRPAGPPKRSVSPTTDKEIPVLKRAAATQCSGWWSCWSPPMRPRPGPSRSAEITHSAYCPWLQVTPGATTRSTQRRTPPAWASGTAATRSANVLHPPALRPDDGIGHIRAEPSILSTVK
jgi:hypothetical protein